MKLTRHHALRLFSKRTTIYIIGVLAGIVIVSQFLHANHLNDHVSQLESEIAYQRKELAGVLRERCSTSKIRESNTTLTFTIQSSGGERSYHVRTPAQYSYNSRTPAVIVFTGKGGTGAEFESIAKFQDNSVLSIYPEPLRDADGITSWQGAPYSPKGVSDVRFTADMIRQLTTDFCIDADKIYTVGMSNGGGIAYLSSCYLSDTIAATASISGAYYKKFQNCPHQARPMPTLAVHSHSDVQVPYTGSVQRQLIPIETWSAQRAKDNHCKPDPKVREARTFTLTEWQECEQEANVTLLALEDKPHGWMALPDITADPNTPDQDLSGFIWDFLRKHRRN
ncbi:hypothetical protein KI440_02640 [Candidatus Saccharibacteria bacterium TM7i]|nr:hypothetical protein KI440_02640 [Candidatus Saccharibacteria bacterium TM7i]